MASSQLEQVEDDIAQIRKQIRELTSRRRTISSSLLTSTKVQKALSQRDASWNENLAADELPVVSSSAAHAQSNIHRLTFSTTAFPFTDPSPHSPERLLGVRLDVCRRNGKFEKPYYVLLKRVGSGKALRVYRHTVPVFIPLRELEEQYLPLPDDEETNLASQDLHMFVRKLRYEVTSWVARCEAVEILQEELGLTTEVLPNGIKAVSAAGVDARYIRVQWSDGRIGRIKLTNKGFVERAVVYGREGRDSKTEKVLADGKTAIRNLAKIMNKE